MHAFSTPLHHQTERAPCRDTSLMTRLARPATTALAALALTLGSAAAQAQDALEFAIAPFLPETELTEAYTPVAEYLSEEIGEPVELKLYPSYLAFWEATRGGSDFDIVLDAAPVTDFRAQRQDWRVIARFDGEVTQSLITREDDLVFSPSELVNEPVAVQPSPSVSALVLYHLFPNPVQQPKLVFRETNRDVAEAVIDGDVRAAVMPTPLVGGYGSLYTVVTTDSLPFLAFSVSPRVTPGATNALREALISFGDTDEGQEILRSQNLTEIVPADNGLYRGHSELLQGTYGY
ncbi:MAG: phosphate/phosphite/phosphonate ABC transporter substrate-binding protein [Pseudomonadota bacterium]